MADSRTTRISGFVPLCARIGNATGSRAAGWGEISLKWKDDGRTLLNSRFAPGCPLSGWPALGAHDCATGGGAIPRRLGDDADRADFDKGYGEEIYADDQETRPGRQEGSKTQKEGEQGSEARANGANQAGLCCLGGVAPDGAAAGYAAHACGLCGSN